MNTRRDFLRHASTCALLPGTLLLQNAVSFENSQKPNIVFFFIDDMGWQDTSEPFHTQKTELNQRYHTPNMERFFKEGMKFTQAYAYAVCSPSRVSIMTGLNAARHRVTNWTLRKDKSPDTPHSKITPPKWNLNGLNPEPGIPQSLYATTLPQILQDNGYHTIHAGKAHFGAKETPGNDPSKLGFDINIAGHAAGGPGSYHGDKNFSAVWRNGDKIWDVPDLEEYHGKDIHLTEALTIEANKAIDKAVKNDQPFYLYMSHYAVHAPWEKDKRFYQKYIDAGLDDFDATFASMVEGMDHSFGEILANLDKHGIADNTIVVFMSDNGSPSQTDRNLPLRGHKLTPYEGGTRVPLMVKYPGVTKAGSVCDDYVMIDDIFPTFLDMAGIDQYEQVAGPVDGYSFVPLLKDEDGYPEDRPLFWHYPHNYAQTPYSSVRRGDWKLIYHHIDRKKELFNLKDDLSEQNDLAAIETEKVNEMSKLLSNFLTEVDALMPIDNETGRAIEFP